MKLWLAVLVFCMEGSRSIINTPETNLPKGAYDSNSFNFNNHRLYHELMENYDPTLSPYNTQNLATNNSLVPGDPATVQLALKFARLIRVEEREQQVYTVLSMILKWHEPRLAWDPAEYGGIDHLYIHHAMIWHPQVSVCDSSSSNAVLGDNSAFVMLNSSGHVEGHRSFQITYICEFDISEFPFDVQQCQFCFLMHHYTQKEAILIGEIHDHLMVYDTSEWILSNFHVTNYDYNRFDMSVLMYNITLTRRSEFWVKLLICPSFFIGCLIVVGVFLSAENDTISNAVNLGLTTMMSMTVILGILADSVPKSKDLPILGHYVLYEIVIIEAAVMSILTMKKLRRAGYAIIHWIGYHVPHELHRSFGHVNHVESIGSALLDHGMASTLAAVAAGGKDEGGSTPVNAVVNHRLRAAQWRHRLGGLLHRHFTVRNFLFTVFFSAHLLNMANLLSHYRGSAWEALLCI